MRTALCLLALAACHNAQVRGLDADASAPAALDFGKVAPGLRKTLPLSIQNIGVVELGLSDAHVLAPFSVDALPGNIETGASAELQLTFAPDAVGTFTQTLKITTTSSKTPAIEVQLTGEAPLPLPDGLSVAPDALEFDVPVSGAPGPQALSVTNTSDSALSWSVTSDGAELSLTPASGDLGARAGAPVLVALTPTADRTDVTRHLAFATGGTVTANVAVQIHYLTNGASFDVTPQQLTLAAPFGTTPTPQTFQITSTGTGGIHFTLTADSALGVTPSSGTAPATITVSLAQEPDHAGAFDYDVHVVTQEAGGKHVAVAVQLAPPAPPAQYGASVWPKFHQGNTLTGLSSIFTRTTGAVRWKVPFGPARMTAVQGTYVGSPALGADGTIYQLGGDSSAGTVRAFEPLHGNPRWIVDITPPASQEAASIEATPTVTSSGDIFVMTGSEANGVHHFYKISAAGHATTLAGDVSPDDAYQDGFDSSPALGADGTLYLAYDEGPSIVLFSQGLSEQGRVSIAGSRTYASDIETQSGAIADDGTGYWSTNGQLYVTSQTQLLWSWDATGHGNATTNMSSRQAPTLTPDGHVVFAWSKSDGTNSSGNITTTLTMLTSGTEQGVKVWETALPAGPPVVTIGATSGSTCDRSGACFTERLSISSPAQGPDGTIYVGHMDGLYALDPANGSVKFHVAGATVASSPAVGADGTIFYGDMAGRLTAVSPAGDVLWSVSTAGQVNSSPAIGADGTVYFASDDGYLYAVQ